MASPKTVIDQQTAEVDSRVQNFSVSHVGSRLGAKWWLSQANHRLGANFHPHIRDLIGPSSEVICALQLGGDNYSLDYGLPWDYIAVDRYLQKRDIPIVLWGASVGPFEADTGFASIAYDHLRTLDGIFVRETASRDYLASKGVKENVRLVADPAFCMSPIVPSDPTVLDLVSSETIGINISPLVARFSHTHGDLAEWRQHATSMIEAVAHRLQRPILLVPHVGSPKHDEDDFSFLQSVYDIVSKKVSTPISIAPSHLNGAEMKWLIGECNVFAGARTHSTIAALSSCVPTLSLSYSVKAIGINQDIFGHQDYCKSVKSTGPEEFAELIEDLVNNADSIREHLREKIPESKRRANWAGEYLAEILQR